MRWESLSPHPSVLDGGCNPCGPSKDAASFMLTCLLHGHGPNGFQLVLSHPDIPPLHRSKKQCGDSSSCSGHLLQ